MKKILEQVKDKDFDTVRLVLLSKSFAFSLDIRAAKEIKDKTKKATIFRDLARRLKVPESFIYEYSQSGVVKLENIEAQESVYWVHDLAQENKKNVIDEDGAYIRFDPTKTDRFYKKIIKQLRSSFAFMDATEKEKEAFVKSGGKSASHFLDNKKAKQERNQHGSNFEQDIKVYITCEKTFKQINDTLAFSVDVGDSKVKKNDEAAFTKNGLTFAAEKMKLPYNKVTRIYYEVVSRYHLPTLTKHPFPLDL